MQGSLDVLGWVGIGAEGLSRHVAANTLLRRPATPHPEPHAIVHPTGDITFVTGERQKTAMPLLDRKEHQQRSNQTEKTAQQKYGGVARHNALLPSRTTQKAQTQCQSVRHEYGAGARSDHASLLAHRTLLFSCANRGT